MTTLPGLEPPRPEVRAVQVLLDTPVPHLDQPFDYMLPDGMDAPLGCRVLVPLAGRRTPAYVVGHEPPSHRGRLLGVMKVVSALPVLTEEVYTLCQAVARATAGSTADVVRLAVPARHARVEQNADLTPGPVPHVPAGETSGWTDYRGGGAFLRHVRKGGTPRAVWTALPGVSGAMPRWCADLASAVAACLASGRRALVIVPTAREMELVIDAFDGLGDVLAYHADLSGKDRYRAFVRMLAGQCDVVVGTRSAAYAPLPDLGLVAIWDADDDSLAERHAPYPTALHAVTRRRDCAVLIGSLSRPVRAQLLVEDGWAVAVEAERAVTRACAPRVEAPDATDLRGDRSRLPEPAFRMLRAALDNGPVLVHVPRSGYLHAIRCATCFGEVRCTFCAGPLTISPSGATCAWCGRGQRVTCSHCGGHRLRATRVGSERTAEEIGRQFPSIPVVISSARTGITRQVDSRPRVVIATPGAEPIAEKGYTAAIVLDAAVATARPALDAGAEAVGRWITAASLVRPSADGGRVMIVGNPDARAAQACVRWDPAGYAGRELEEREKLRFPPCWRVVRFTGPYGELEGIARELDADVLGPVDDTLLVRAPRSEGRSLVDAVAVLSRARSAHKREPVRVHVDPPL